VRWSQTLIPTMKEIPSDAEIPSHQLMLRAGLIRQVMAGAYTYLPLGYRAVRKVEAIVRNEMERCGAIELFMPALCPAELWEQTGRIDDYGNALIHFPIVRGDRQVHVVLGPTHEEVVTDLIARQIKSYKQLPITVFQIQTKFRNEERPRFGVMRTSEFQMKDAYSFGANLEQLNHAYEQMYHAYRRIFSRCGLDYRPVEAESGPIGGDASHEFMVPAANGEDEIVHCNSCDYAANTERAETGRPAPEIAAPAQMAELDSVETPDAGSIEQVCRMLGCEPKRMIKTLIYQADEQTVAVLVRGDHEANEAKIRRALGADSVELADPKTIIEVTGAPVGFAGPVGLSCPLLADHDVVEIVDAVTGANQKDTHLSGVNIVRDYSLETSYDLRMATAQDPCPRCDGSLELARGIEVGHVFKLGTKYSTALSALYLDENEVKHPMLMGCYGIGINRIVAATAETSHDENGLIWPLSIAPYQVLLIPLNIDDQEVMAAAESIYQQLDQQLGSQGVDVLMDDRKARPGFKFKDADLVGIPLKIIVGGKGLADGVVELKWRTDHEARRIPLEDIVATIGEEIAARVAVEAEAVPE